MTNEKAIDLLSMVEFEHAECCLNTWYKGIDDDMKEAIKMAIKALEIIQTGLLKDCESCRAELPCTDAISRQAVLEGLASIAKAKAKSDAQKSMMGRTMFFVEQLPPVSTEKTDWIPVSERLPENAFGCLVTVEEDDIYGEPQRVIYPEFVGYDGETWNDASGKQIAFEVIAWMPLPQSYKEKSEE